MIWKRSARVLAGFALVLVVLLGFFRWQTFRREQLSRREAAPQSGRFVKADDVEIFLQEEGPSNGSPVILIHGTGAWSEIWRETMSALAKEGFRAIAIDVPPFGYSEKPTGPASYDRARQAKRILGVLDTLQLQRAYFVGHSVGSRPTLEAALIAPDRVRGLVLVDPALGVERGGSSTFPPNKPSWILRTVFGILPLRNVVLAVFGTNPMMTKRLFSSFVSRTEAVTETRVRMLQQPLEVKGMTSAQGDWLHNLMISSGNSLGTRPDEFSRLRMPIHLIWGRTDTVTPLWHGELLQKLLPGATLTVIDGVGHIPYIEDPDGFHRDLLAFLTSSKKPLGKL